MSSASALIAALVWNERLLNYTTFASIALYIYDHASMFSAELRWMWLRGQSKFRLIQVLFFATRYLVYVDIGIALYRQTTIMITPKLDLELLKVTIRLTVPGSLIAGFILIFRTYAIYERSKWLALSLIGILLLQHIPILILNENALDSLIVVPSPIPKLLSPIVMVKSLQDAHLFLASMVTTMVMEMLILVLTLKKGFFHLWLRNDSNIVQTLYRDGVIFFFCISALALGNILNVIFNHLSATLLLLPMRVLHAALSARILLHLLQAAETDPLSPPGTCFSTHFSSVESEYPSTQNIELGDIHV